MLLAPLDLELYYPIIILSNQRHLHLRCISDVSCRLVGGICRLHLFDLLHQGLDLRGTSKFLDFQLPSYDKLCQAARICHDHPNININPSQSEVLIFCMIPGNSCATTADVMNCWCFLESQHNAQSTMAVGLLRPYN